VAFVETERGLGVDEEPYFCTVTIPDDGIAKVSAKDSPSKQCPDPLWQRSPSGEVLPHRGSALAREGFLHLAPEQDLSKHRSTVPGELSWLATTR
jgi:hypothetical protein